MRRRDLQLFEEIRRDSLRSDLAVSDTLRKVMALGGAVGSTSLRAWASRELNGYVGSDIELPSYRVPGAVIKVDAIVGTYQVTGQQMSPHMLPTGIKEHIREEVSLNQGIGEIEALARRARQDGGSVRVSLPDAQLIATLMNHEAGRPYQQILALYWVLGQTSLEGVVDRVRTILVELVAEMNAGMPSDAVFPSSDVADQAVNVAVFGSRNRVKLQHVQSTVAVHAEVRPWWRTLGAGLGGLAGVAAAIAAVATWQGWWGA